MLTTTSWTGRHPVAYIERLVPAVRNGSEAK